MDDLALGDRSLIRMSNSLFKIPGTEYLIKNIDTVEVLIIHPDRKNPRDCIALGMLLIPAFGLGLLLVCLGLYWYVSQKNKYAILLISPGEDVQGYISLDYSEAVEIQSVLDTIIS